MLRSQAGVLKTTLPLLCFFSLPKNSFYLCKLFLFHFFYLLSSPVPLQKSPNNHFFDKVSTVLFFLFHLFFLLFLGFRDYFTFWLFFSSGFGECKTVESGWDLIGSFLPSDVESRRVCWCIKPFFPGHVTPHCWSHWWIFMGVFCSLHKLKQWLVLVGPTFWILSSNTNAFYFSAKGCQKVVSCVDIHFLRRFACQKKKNFCYRGLYVGFASHEHN